MLRNKGATSTTRFTPDLASDSTGRPRITLPPKIGYDIEITFTINSAHAPALKSAVEEISNIVGARIEGSHKYAKEDALTAAALGLGILRKAITAKVPQGDPNYA